MPMPKAVPDLEAWAGLIPQERSNDTEFNLLIHKFKSFYNEVKEYQKLHSDCLVTRLTSDERTQPPLQYTDQSNVPASSSSQHNATSIFLQRSALRKNSLDDDLLQEPIKSATLSSLSHQRQPHKINGQHVINLRKKFSQEQEHGLPTPKETKQLVSNQNNVMRVPPKITLQNMQGRSIDSPMQLYSSSNNLISLNSNASSINNQTGTSNSQLKQPEIRQRSQMNLSSHLLTSRSSERLDSINNNYRGASSLEDSLEIKISQNCPKMAVDAQYQPDDSNIYDAVSPDVDPIQSSERICSSNVNNSNLRGILDNPQQSRINLNRGADVAPPLPVPMTISNTPNNKSSDQEPSINSHGSSVLFNGSNNTSSSLSLVPNYHDQEYGNYVNIDFFLKRNRSPSFDDLDERNDSDVDTSDEDTTQLSKTYSNSQLCDDSLKDLSPRELARKLSTTLEQTNSSSSLTPASSGDFLDDTRSPTALQMSTTSSFSKHFEINNKQRDFFSSTVNRESDSSIQAKNSATALESFGSRISLVNNQKGPTIMPENQTTVSPKQSFSRESSSLLSDSYALNEAQTSMRSFLSDLNLSPTSHVFEDKSQRRIVKESFAVESSGRRKLRHLFLFNDVIVCAKYQASSKQKFTFDVKWYLNLNGVSVSDVDEANNQVKIDKEAMENQILSIRTSLMLLRARMQQIKRSKDKRPSKIIKKLKKKRTELEAELVLLLPHLPLVIKHANGKKFLFFLSSNFDRNQWIESIKYLQSQLPSSTSTSSPSSSELQAWIQTCRKNLNPSLGTFLLRSNCDDDLLHGDLFINMTSISGLPKPGQYYFCFEVDSYGHFSQKASSAVLRFSEIDIDLNEEYVLPLDGAHTLRILLYEDSGQSSKPLVIGKAQVELSRAWFLDKPVERIIEFNINCRALARLSYSNLEMLSIRIPHVKLCPTFGIDITQVCKKEKTTVPMLIQLCVNEVERRGMREVGIYRMSGTSTDIQRLKKAFETNPYVAELLLRDIDINSVTGFLKTYLREMPEGLFINKLYLKFVAAFNIPQTESLERTKRMLELFHKIPLTNQHTIIYLVEHLVKVNKYESYNKMSLTNLATVLGPNILRPPADSNSNDSSDPFTAVVIGSMSQAGILYFFLNRRASNLPLTELDQSEIESRTSEA
jgi:hypothetical protein